MLFCTPSYLVQIAVSPCINLPSPYYRIDNKYNNNNNNNDNKNNNNEMQALLVQ